MDGNEQDPRYASSLGPRPGGMGPRIAVAALVLLAGGAAAWRFMHRSPPPAPAPPPDVVAPPAPAPVATVPAVSAPEGDAVLRDAAPSLSASKDLADWLSQGGILRRLVAGVNLVAEGKSPRAVLGFLAPEGPFEVVTRDGATFGAETNGARYDRAVGVLTSVDVSVAAKTYAKLKPFIQAAYAEVAPPNASFDRALHETLQSLASTPLPASPPALVPKGALYAYADPKLEALTAPQKNLLRLGDKNARAVQGWLKALEESLVPASP